MLAPVAALGAVAVLLLVPAAARAHGDPVSEALLDHNLFLPSRVNPNSAAARRLDTIVREANEAGDVKVAVVAEPSDLGARAPLYGRPARLAEFLSTDGSAQDGVVVVTPRGVGYAIGGKRFPAEAAPPFVRRLAVAADRVVAPMTSSGSSETRDRIKIAAAALVGAVILAGVMLYRRRRRTLKA